MTGVIATIPKFSFSANGVPMVSGTLTVYLAGTTTPTDTWQDQALTTLNTNPVVLDARGECVLWLDSTKSYKFVLKNAGGVTQWTQDNISGGGSLADRLRTDLAASSGASLVGYLPAGTEAVATTVQTKLRESVSVKDFGAVGDGITNDTAAIQAALNTGRVVYAPAGQYKITTTLLVPVGGGICGEGQKTVLVRAFTGGRLIGYPSGTSFILRDFAITTSVGVVVVAGDTGIDIGYTATWTGAGDINNLTITKQWDGFKWTSGTMNVMNNIQCVENKGHGFFSINGRGPLNNCLSQYNSGDGVHYYSSDGSQTGFVAADVGTFGNQGYGFLFTGSVSGGNIYLTQCGSSNDGKGGIAFTQQFTMCFLNQGLIEGAGNAYLTPYGAANGFVQYATAHALSAIAPVPGTSPCDSFFVSDFFIATNNGAGIYLVGLQNSHFNNITISNSGVGGLGGAYAVGLNLVSNNANVQFNNLFSIASGATQVYDIAVSTSSNSEINFGLVSFKTIYNPANSPVRFNSIANNPTGSTAVASVSVMQLLDWTDFITITGTQSINVINVSYVGRRVTLLFSAALTISTAYNIKLSGGASFISTANDTLTLVCDGTNWYEVSRSAN